MANFSLLCFKDFEDEEKILRKRYWALVIGSPRHPKGMISAPLRKVRIFLSYPSCYFFPWPEESRFFFVDDSTIKLYICASIQCFNHRSHVYMNNSSFLLTTGGSG